MDADVITYKEDEELGRHLQELRISFSDLELAELEGPEQYPRKLSKTECKAFKIFELVVEKLGYWVPTLNPWTMDIILDTPEGIESDSP